MTDQPIEITIHVPAHPDDDVSVDATFDEGTHYLSLLLPNDGHLDREAIGSLLSVAPAAIMQAIEQLEEQP